MRNKLLFLAGCCFVLSSGFAQVTTNIKAFYSFSGNADNGLGTGVNNFQEVGSPLLTEDRFGNPDCAYAFPGDNVNYLTLPFPTSDVDVNYTDGWSISLWYQGGSSDGGDLERIFMQGTDSFLCNQVALYDLNKPVVDVFDYNTGDYPHQVWADDPSNINHYMDSTLWHHVVMSVKPNDFINLYVDNVLQAGSLTSQNVFDYCGLPIRIGHTFKGKVDDVIIYHKPLSATEVDTLFNLPSFCSQDPLSIHDVDSDEGIKLYPNPVSSVLNITSENGYELYKVTDVLGKVVLKGQLEAKEHQLDISTLPNGIYYLTLDKQFGQAYKFSVIH